MKNFTIIILSILSSLTLAATNAYDLKIQFAKDDGPKSKGRLLIKSGQTGTIMTSKKFLEVIPAEGKMIDQTGIMLNFTFGSIAKDGSKIIENTPQLLVKENEEAQISIDDFFLSVTALRKKI